MNVPELSKNLAIIQQLRDHPNDEDGLAPDDLKAKFDEAAEIIKAYLNDTVVPALNRAVSKDENGDVNIGDREFTAGKLIICSDHTREGFYMKSSLEGDDNASPVAEMSGTNDDGIPVIIRNVAPGINDNDVVNKKQLEETIAPLIVTINKNDSFELVATHTPDSIYNASLSQRKVFLQTKDGYFPCVLADDSRAMFAQMDYEEGKILGYYVFEDGTVEAIEKIIAFTNEAPRIDDDVVSPNKIWSSKNTVDRLCPSFEKSGLLVQCEPVNGYPLEVSADGEFVVTVCGKNLYNAKDYPMTDDQFINSINGSVNTTTSGYCATLNFIPVSHLVGQKIYLNYRPGGSNPGMMFYRADESIIVGSGGKGDGITVPEGAAFMRFTSLKANKDEIQIEIGSSATDFEAYRSHTVNGSGSAVVTALKGINNVFAFAGDNAVDIAVSGRADPVTVIEKLTNAVISLGGNV